MDKELLLKDVDPYYLTNLKDIKVDCNLPVANRKKFFIEQAKSVYLFNVNGKAVKILFERNGNTLEQRLLVAIKNTVRAD